MVRLKTEVYERSANMDVGAISRSILAPPDASHPAAMPQTGDVSQPTASMLKRMAPDQADKIINFISADMKQTATVNAESTAARAARTASDSTVKNPESQVYSATAAVKNEPAESGKSEEVGSTFDTEA